VGNFNYGSSLDFFHDVFEYDAEPILGQIDRHYNKTIKDEDILHDGMYSKLDSLILSSFIRDREPWSVMEIGGGCSTNIMLEALRHNNGPAFLKTYSPALMSEVNPPDDVGWEQVEGCFLDSFEHDDEYLDNVDLCFIDAAHHAHFALFYFFYVMQKLPKGALIHIHDIQNPEVLQNALDKGFVKLHAQFFPVPAITCEIYALYLLLQQYPGRYKVLCNTNDLQYKYTKQLKHIKNVEHGTFEKRQGAVSCSLWLEVIQ
jgi:hypothetical protein